MGFLVPLGESLRAASNQDLSKTSAANKLSKASITRQPNDPVDTVRVNGHLAHRSRFLAQINPDQAGPRVAADASVSAPVSFQSSSELVVLQMPVIQADQVGSSSVADSHLKNYGDELERLQTSGNYLYVEPDYLVSATATPTDTFFTDGSLWGLRNTGQDNGVAGADINAVPAWDITTGSSQVIVAVIDSGMRTTHQDLAPNLWQNPGEIPGNGIDDDANGIIDDIHGIDAINNTGTPTDTTSHGTHVAGTIGAAGNAGGPHVGVAWDVQLMGLKFLSTQTGFTSDAIECIHYAIAKGADIINASWGGSGFSLSLRNAIVAAEQAGILFVAAAGNDSLNNDSVPHYPSNHTVPNVISVAALDRQDALASFSNFGATSVDLGAPGQSILSSHAQDDSAYAFSSGTSMAAPHVAGVAALVKSQFPNITVADLKARILNSTTPVNALATTTLTGGRVNAHGALTNTGDGILEFQIGLSQIPVIAGREVSVFVTVSDTLAVTGATVTAEFLDGVSSNQVSAAAPVTLLDNGVAPDPSANDGQYAGAVLVPATATDPATLKVTADAAGKTPGEVTATVAVISPPSNDSFANRILIPIGSTSTTGTNTAASRETGEALNPPTGLATGGSTVWWTWTAPSTGPATIHTSATNFDTTLAVYRGGTLSLLGLIASNDDQGGGTDSGVTFLATAGVEYHIQVDGFNAAQGNFTLNFPEVTAATGHAQVVGDPSVTHSRIGEAVTLHADATGQSPLSFQWYLNGNPIPGASSKALTIPTTSIQDLGDYSVEASNSLGNEFSRTIPLSLSTPGAPPANDNFSSAIELPGTSGSAVSDNLAATAESGEPNHAGNSGANPSVWWRWQAPSNGVLKLRTLGIELDTTLAAYTGNSVNALVPAASNDNANASAPFLQSEISLLVQANQTYSIAVSGAAGATGPVRLDYQHTPFLESNLANSNFESGNLQGWQVTDFTNPQTPAASTIGTTVINPLLPFSTITPSSGHFAFAHGFEAQTPGTLQMTQNTTLELEALSLLVDYRAGWTFSTTSPPTQPRTFKVIVEPTGGGAALVDQTLLSTGLSSLANTGSQTAIIPLSNLSNQDVTIRFEWTVPEGSTGPAFFELDNLRLIQGCERRDGLTFSIASTALDLSTGNHFHSLPSETVPGVAEIGRFQQEAIRGFSEFDLRNSHLASNVTLHFKVLTAGGQVGGVNDFPFTGSIELDSYNPTTHHDPDLQEFQAISTGSLHTLQTAGLAAGTPIEIDITQTFNQSVIGNLESIGTRLQANPLPAENAGAWTFDDFKLVIDCRVFFTDAQLEQGLRSALGIPSAVITTADLATLTSLSLPNAGIANLQGLEFAVNLTSLDLQSNQLTDLAPIANLTGLQDTASPGLQVQDNLLDIAPGSTQRQLINSLSAIAGLTVAFRPQRIIDTDNDGLDDRFEQRIIDANASDSIANLGDVTSAGDFDGDQETNREEFLRFSDPTDGNDFVRPGDLDNDGNVTILDLVILQSHISSTSPLEPDLISTADTNLDGEVNQADQSDVINHILSAP